MEVRNSTDSSRQQGTRGVQTLNGLFPPPVKSAPKQRNVYDPYACTLANNSVASPRLTKMHAHIQATNRVSCCVCV